MDEIKKAELADGDTKCVEIVDKTDYKAKQFCMCDFETQTNRQWLESLSDEELAGHLGGRICCYVNCNVKVGCDNCKKNWLRAEHKE